MGTSICPSALAWPTSFPLDDHRPSSSEHELSPVLEACGVGALEVSVACPEFAGSWLCYMCYEAVTYDSDSQLIRGCCVWREGVRVEDVSLKSTPLFISLAIKTLGGPAASLLLAGSGVLKNPGLGLWAVIPQTPPFPRRLNASSPARVCQ